MAIILVVDDDPVTQITLKARLKRAGHAVVATNCAAEAVAYLQANIRPDLIVLDVGMPLVTGAQLAQCRSAAPAKAVPLLFVLDDPTPEACARARQLGGVGILKSPWQNRDLYAAVDRALGEKARQRPQASREAGAGS